MATEVHPAVLPNRPAKARFFRRNFRSAALSLAAGTLLTIAIAWASAIASTLLPSATRGGPDLRAATFDLTRADHSTSMVALMTSSTWLASTAQIGILPRAFNPGASSDNFAPLERLLTPWSRPLLAQAFTAAERDPNLFFKGLVSAYGLPFRCLCTTRSNNWSADFTPSPSTIGELPLSPAIQAFLNGGVPPVTVPTDPSWPGLVINIMFWSLFTRVLLALAAAGRRHLRRKKGLCPFCAYSRSGLSAATPCPECGSAATLAAPPTHR